MLFKKHQRMSNSSLILYNQGAVALFGKIFFCLSSEVIVLLFRLLLVLLHVAVVGVHHLLALLGRDGNHADIEALLGHETILGEIETVVHLAMHVVIDLAVFTV